MSQVFPHHILIIKPIYKFLVLSSFHLVLVFEILVKILKKFEFFSISSKLVSNFYQTFFTAVKFNEPLFPKKLCNAEMIFFVNCKEGLVRLFFKVVTLKKVLKAYEVENASSSRARQLLKHPLKPPFPNSTKHFWMRSIKIQLRTEFHVKMYKTDLMI